MLLTYDSDRFQSFDEERLSDRERQAWCALRLQSAQWMIASRAASVTVGRYRMRTDVDSDWSNQSALYAPLSTSARLGIAEIARLENDGRVCVTSTVTRNNELSRTAQAN